MNIGTITQLTNHPPALPAGGAAFPCRAPSGCSAPRRKLVNHLDFFRRVLDGTMKLANDRDADCFASWKVGGQDFYVYGIEQNASREGGA